MTRKEMIDYIIDEARKNAKDKKVKTRERKLETARLYLIKSTDKEIEDLYARVKEEGAAKVFGDKKNLK